MEVITFKDSAMRRAFVEALLSLGYSNHISVLHTTVWLFFKILFLPSLTQCNNRCNRTEKEPNCSRYHDMTKDIQTHGQIGCSLG